MPNPWAHIKTDTHKTWIECERCGASDRYEKGETMKKWTDRRIEFRAAHKDCDGKLK